MQYKKIEHASEHKIYKQHSTPTFIKKKKDYKMRNAENVTPGIKPLSNQYHKINNKQTNALENKHSVILYFYLIYTL